MKRKSVKRRCAKVAVRLVSSYCLPRHKLRAKLRSVVGELNGLRKHHAETECRVERQAAKIVSLQAEIAALRAKLAEVPTAEKPVVEAAAQKADGPQSGGAI